MTQSLNLTPSTTPLGLDPVWRAAPFAITGAALSGITTYRAQIWRRPQAARASDPDPIATSYGTAASGSVTITFTGESMDFELTADDGAQDDVWLSVSGLQADGQVRILRAGWFRVIESGCLADDFITSPPTWVLQNDVVRFTQSGDDYDLLAMEVAAPSGAVIGEYIIENDVITFTDATTSYAAPCAVAIAPSGLTEGGLLIINDNVYAMQDGQAYRALVAEV